MLHAHVYDICSVISRISLHVCAVKSLHVCVCCSELCAARTACVCYAVLCEMQCYAVLCVRCAAKFTQLVNEARIQSPPKVVFVTDNQDKERFVVYY